MLIHFWEIFWRRMWRIQYISLKYDTHKRVNHKWGYPKNRTMQIFLCFISISSTLDHILCRKSILGQAGSIIKGFLMFSLDKIFFLWNYSPYDDVDKRKFFFKRMQGVSRLSLTLLSFHQFLRGGSTWKGKEWVKCSICLKLQGGWRWGRTRPKHPALESSTGKD